jgi:ElaA protein
MDWHERSFAQLTTRELYAIIELRERVFVVEQRCVYLDADGLDPIATHVWAEKSGALVAYLRILPAGAKFPEASIGRVIVAASERGTGLGRELMQRGIAIADGPIQIGAQAHLQRFYSELGFAAISDVYDEDGIPHVAMIRRAGS